MAKSSDIDGSILSAYVDGMLDNETIELVIKAMDTDMEIRERVYELRKAKDLMKLGYAEAKPPTSSREKSSAYKYVVGTGFSLLLLIMGFAAGFYTNNSIGNSGELKLTSNSNGKLDKVILHISNANPEHFSVALNYIENALKANETKGYQLAVITSTGGVNLLRKGKSGYEQRIVALLNKYDNLYLIACGSVVKGLREKGDSPNLLPNVIVDESAMDEIIERLEHGWKYKKIESLLS